MCLNEKPGVSHALKEDSDATTVTKKSTNRSRSNSIQLLSIASSSEIRSRFLHRLGIRQREHQNHDREISQVTSLIRRRKARATHEPLKGDNGEDDQSLKECRRSSWSDTRPQTSGDSRRRRHVSFDVSVAVYPIARRCDYSQRMQASLWTSQRELRQHVLRNCIEYEAEGWDWHQVCDEDRMVQYDGQMIHPVHFPKLQDQNCNLNIQFCAIRAIQIRQR